MPSSLPQSCSRPEAGLPTTVVTQHDDERRCPPECVWSRCLPSWDGARRRRSGRRGPLGGPLPPPDSARDIPQGLMAPLGRAAAVQGRPRGRPSPRRSHRLSTGPSLAVRRRRSAVRDRRGRERPHCRVPRPRRRSPSWCAAAIVPQAWGRAMVAIIQPPEEGVLTEPPHGCPRPRRPGRHCRIGHRSEARRYGCVSVRPQSPAEYRVAGRPVVVSWAYTVMSVARACPSSVDGDHDEDTCHAEVRWPSPRDTAGRTVGRGQPCCPLTRRRRWRRTVRPPGRVAPHARLHSDPGRDHPFCGGDLGAHCWYHRHSTGIVGFDAQPCVFLPDDELPDQRHPTSMARLAGSTSPIQVASGDCNRRIRGMVRPPAH
jgi:hypothetical protein